MTNLAKKFSVIEQPSRQKQPKRQTVKGIKKARISIGEKILWLALGLAVFFALVTTISRRGEIHHSSVENLEMQSKIDSLLHTTTELEVEVQSLTTYERIAEIARRHGLTINEDNVRTIE